MGLKNVIGVYLTCLHNIVINMLPKKMVSNRHSFLDQGATSIIRVKTTFVFSKKLYVSL